MHLLFDLDGTLTDSFSGVTRSIRHALRRLGADVPPAERLKWCIGPPLHESFRHLLATDDDELVDHAVKIYRERFGTIGLLENEIYPGIADCLQELTAGGHCLGVATAKPTVFARRILDHFELSRFFSGIDGSELDGTRSDKGSLIKHLLAREGLDAGNVIMIGDRSHDMIGAAVNGVRGIGVLWGYGSRDDLESAGAQRCVVHPSELRSAIQETARDSSFGRSCLPDPSN